MTPVLWTKFASEKLTAIHEYVSYESGSEKIASRYINRILRKTDQLRTAPLSGAKEPLLRKFSGNYRFLIEGSYKIIYTVTQTGVYILDIFHMKQNPSKMLRRE